MRQLHYANDAPARPNSSPIATLSYWRVWQTRLWTTRPNRSSPPVLCSSVSPYARPRWAMITCPCSLARSCSSLPGSSSASSRSIVAAAVSPCPLVFMSARNSVSQDSRLAAICRKYPSLYLSMSAMLNTCRLCHTCLSWCFRSCSLFGPCQTWPCVSMTAFIVTLLYQVPFECRAAVLISGFLYWIPPLKFDFVINHLQGLRLMVSSSFEKATNCSTVMLSESATLCHHFDFALLIVVVVRRS